MRWSNSAARLANVVAGRRRRPVLRRHQNGAMGCEAVIFFDAERASNFPYQRKRAGQTSSKGRYLGAQMAAYLENGLWLRSPGAPTTRRGGWRTGCRRRGIRLAWPRRVNEVFPITPRSLAAALKAEGVGFGEWSSRATAPSRTPRRGSLPAARLLVQHRRGGDRQVPGDRQSPLRRRGAGAGLLTQCRRLRAMPLRPLRTIKTLSYPCRNYWGRMRGESLGVQGVACDGHSIAIARLSPAGCGADPGRRLSLSGSPSRPGAIVQLGLRCLPRRSSA